MKDLLFEKAVNIDGVTVPVECKEIIKKSDKPDYFSHYHEYPEILYLIQGNLKIWLSDKLYEVKKGELIVINSNETHRIVSVADESKYVIIKFTPKLLCTFQQTPGEIRYVLPFLAQTSNRPRVYSESFVRKTKINELIIETINEWNDKNVGYELALKANVLKIIRYIISYLNEQGLTVKSYNGNNNIQQIMSAILEYINENFKTLSETDVANHFGVSYSYFSRSFKQIMNMSFKEYVNHLKINDAQKLLLTTDKSVAEIAEELGYSSPSHFINVFKKFKNCSPKQYKKNAQFEA